MIQRKKQVQNESKKLIKNSISEGNIQIKLDYNDNKKKNTLESQGKIHIIKYNKVLSNISPTKTSSPKNIKAIDFKRMKPHSLNSLINTNILKNPSICYYNPKYDAFIKKKYVIFNNNKKDMKTKRKNLMKKIWSSYDVYKEYLSIDNKKLDEGINKEL